jgi:hypothetical protein
MLFFTLILALGAVTAQNASAAAVPGSVSDPVKRADRALTNAVTHLANNHPGRAVRALLVVKRQVYRANIAAMNQIGKPPTDPESDDIPGPPAVVAVLSLDHRVAKGLVTVLNGQANSRVVDTLLLTLEVMHHRRIALLGKVIALPAEGDFGEYSDLIADRLAIYTQEVNQASSALSTYTLTAVARDGLGTVLDRASATKAKVDAAFGGGE